MLLLSVVKDLKAGRVVGAKAVNAFAVATERRATERTLMVEDREDPMATKAREWPKMKMRETFYFDLFHRKTELVGRISHSGTFSTTRHVRTGTCSAFRIDE